MNISSINSTEHGRSPSMHRATSCAWFRPRRHPPATGCCLLISRRVAFVYDYCGLVRRCYYRLPTVAADSITGARKWLCSTENGREPIHDKDGRPAVIIQSFQKQTTIKFPPFFLFRYTNQSSALWPDSSLLCRVQHSFNLQIRIQHIKIRLLLIFKSLANIFMK